MEEQCLHKMKKIKQNFNLNNKVAVITGSSKGIGASIAHAYAEFGAKVIVSSRKAEDIEKVAEEIKNHGYECEAIPCHVGDSEQRKNLIEKTIEIYGSIDILVNNAAINPVSSQINSVGSEVFDKIMDINVKAPFELSNLCFPYFKNKGNGVIINIASVEGIKPSYGLGLYAVSKSALIMLSKCQGNEWGKFGIRSNTICPGLIKTKLSSALWNNDSVMKMINTRLPLRRIGEPSEIAGLALFLASDASSYCNGQSFTADGGYMII